MKRWKEIKLIANDDYWNDRPYIDEMLGMVFESEEEDILAVLKLDKLAWLPL